MKRLIGDHRLDAEFLDILDMPGEVRTAVANRFDILRAEVFPGDAAMHFQSPHGGDQHHGVRRQPRLAALDIEEFLRAQIGAEAGLGHDVVGQFQCRRRRRHRIAAMGDVGERPAVDESRVVLQRLDDIRHQRVFQQHRHRRRRLDVGRAHRLAGPGVADDDITDTLGEVVQVGRQAEDRHDLRRHGDVEPVLAGKAVGDAAERRRNLAQGAVVHIDDAAEGDPAGVEAGRVAPVDVVVNHRGEQVVGDADGVEVAGEMEVDILHRHNLGIAAAGRPALHAEAGSERGLAQAHGRALADPVQAVAEADSRRRLALARRGRRDRGDQDQLAVRPVLERADEVVGNFRLVRAVLQQPVRRDIQLLADFGDRLEGGFAGDFDIGFYGHDMTPLPGRRPPAP